MLCIVAVALATLAVAAPADAESRTFNDRTGEISSGVDIRSLNVNMTAKQLILTSHHRALGDNQQYSYYIDTRIGRSGPEYLLSGILGGDYQLFHAGNTVEGWGATSGPINCSMPTRVSYAYDTIRTAISINGCLRGASHARVAMWAGTSRATDNFPDSFGTWLPWVRRDYVSATPALYTCQGAPTHAPSAIQIACGDGNGYFDRARWSTWNSTYASGTAREHYNTCNPNCAAGNYRYFTVRFRLDRPVTRSAMKYFTRVRWGRTTLAHTVPASTPNI